MHGLMCLWVMGLFEWFNSGNTHDGLAQVAVFFAAV